MKGHLLHKIHGIEKKNQIKSKLKLKLILPPTYGEKRISSLVYY
jgi:hypothetical protein